MTNYTYGTIATSGNSFTLVGDTNGKRPETPKGLIATQAVETKAGWLGQVFIDKKIVFESAEAHDHADKAISEANERVVAAVSKLFDA